MEIIILILILIGIFWAISEIVEKHRQKVRNQLAHEILDGEFDFLKEKEEILSIRKILQLSKIDGIRPILNFIKVTKVLPKIKKRFSLSSCQLCGGKLIKKKGSYGYFWGCKNYPKCRFTKNSK
ncbi:MAG: topoisomerase DNA-binding C4 zinc finger domain-containing protein [Candidatus Paceibacterota bacterium]|jgi:hypothetical protein